MTIALEVIMPTKKPATKTNFQTAMTELANAFTTAERDGGTKYTRFKDANLPEWLAGENGQNGRDVMLAIHSALDSRMPDDWVYENVPALAEAMSHCDDADDAREASHEVADGCVDTYTSTRLEWLGQNHRNTDLCDEAISDGLGSESTEMVDRIGLGQYLGLTRIAGAIIDAVDAEATERDERDESAEEETTDE